MVAVVSKIIEPLTAKSHQDLTLVQNKLTSMEDLKSIRVNLFSPREARDNKRCLVL